MEQTGIRGAESWQFFAFVFTVVIALAFTLIDELHCPWPRITWSAPRRSWRAWAPRSRRKSAQRQHMALRRRDRRWRGACNCARMQRLKPGTAP